MEPSPITDRRQEGSHLKAALEALRKVESPYRVLMDISPDAIVLSDQSGSIIMMNERLARLHGYESPQELTGKNAFELFAPEERQRAAENMELAIKSEPGGGGYFECLLQRKNGTRFWGELFGKSILLPDLQSPFMLTIVRDISERRRAEEALQESETKYRTLVEKANEAIAIAQDGVFVFANRKTSDLVGIPAEDLIGRPFVDFIHTEDRDLVTTNYRKRIAGEAVPDAYDFRVAGAGGSVAWVFLSAATILWKGKPATLNLMTDITERKRMESASRESRERYENFISQISDGIYRAELDEPMPLTLTVDEQIDYLYRHMIVAECNPSFLAMYGIKDAKDIIGKIFNDIIFGANNSLNRSAKRLFIEAGYQINNLVTEETDLQGRKKYFNNNVVGIVENDRLLRLWGTQTDVTDRIRAEEALRESEKKYRALFDNANEAIFVVQDGRLVLFNPITVRMMGYSNEEIGSKPFAEFIDPADRDIVVGQHLKRLKGEDAPALYTIRSVNGAGQIRLAEIRSVLIDWEGRAATLNFANDITERNAAEGAVLASLREKEVLLKEVHHRVKNNMQVISSLFNLQIKHSRNTECRQILKENQSRIRAMGLVHEKLYQSPDLSRIDLASYIDNLAVHLLHALLADPGRVRLEPDLEEVPLDINSAVPCGLILNELIFNALKHAFPDGRRGVIRLGLKRAPDGAVVIRVADDGIGFPKDVDFRHPESFGLQIVNLLIDQLEATIELDRKTGTAFTMTFRELKYARRI